MGRRRDDDSGSFWSWPLAAILLVATVAVLGLILHAWLQVEDWLAVVVGSLVESAMNDPGLLTVVIGIIIVVGSGVLIFFAVLPNSQAQPLQRIAAAVIGVAGLAFGTIFLGAVAVGSLDAAMTRVGPLFFGALGSGLILVGAWAALARGGSITLRVSGLVTGLAGAFLLWVLVTGRVAFE